MPEARLNVVVDSSGTASGSARARSAIQAIRDATASTTKELEKMRQSQQRTEAMARKMVTAIRSAGTAWLIYKGILQRYITNSIEAERVEVQLNAVLQSTGHTAGITANEIKKMATEMQALTIYGDEEIISMQNILLTFKQIKGDEFKRATMAVLDLSTAMGQDLKSSAIQVGKALNDPKIGLTALQRVGITFSDSQKKLIKDLTETGRVAEAQRMIFQELESQFGGSASSATNSLGGALKQLKNVFGDLFEINATSEFGAITESVKQLTATLNTQPVKDFTKEIGIMVSSGINVGTKALRLMADNVEVLKSALAGLAGIKISSSLLAILGISGGTAGMISAGVGGVVYGALQNKKKADEILGAVRKLEAYGKIEKGSLGAGYTGTQLIEMASKLTVKDPLSNSLSAVRSFDKLNAKATPKTPLGGGVTKSGKSGGGASKGKTDAELALERIKIKAQEAGIEIAAAVERLEGRNKLMEEARLAAEEGITRFNEEMAQVATDKAISAIEALKLQVDIGNISFEQYRDGLEQLKVEFDGMPDAITEIDAAMKALDTSILVSTRTMGSFVREAETALRDKLVGIPDELSGAFAGAIAYSQDLGESLKQLAKEIAYTTLKAFILKSIFGGLGGLGGKSDWHDAGNAILNANGNVFNQTGLVPFANGGIVNKPTLFPFANGVGLMGEAGAEAIMPLKRTSSGDLGVKAEGGGTTNITMNINAVDSRSFVEMMRTNRASVESIVVENIMRNGAVRGAIRGMT